jgi:hypothetical protein
MVIASSFASAAILALMRASVRPMFYRLSALHSREAQISKGSPVRSRGMGSLFSGLFTRVEMGHIVIGSEG